MAPTMVKTIHLHLVSHASGELIEMLARNAVAQLDGVDVERRLWKMVRHLGQVPDILATIAETPGFVVHSVAATDVRAGLEKGCERLGVPCLFTLEPLISQLSEHFDVPVRFRSSALDTIDDDYYQRVEAMKYTLSHDDGQLTNELDNADVILVGVSRATKTPTCMYLASRGVKAANVPLVPGVPLPNGLLAAKHPLVVGLTINPTRLAAVRAARLKALNQKANTDYDDLDSLRKEVREARRIFLRHGWPIIDVTDRSIEQVTNMIIEMLRKRMLANS
jgi:regulator of PEP synthase PpsR (kinase-PPPase family)